MLLTQYFRSKLITKQIGFTSGVLILALNLGTKSCDLTGAVARSTLMISSSVIADVSVSLPAEADAFETGSTEEGGSSLTPNVFASCTTSGTIEKEFDVMLELHDYKP